ncbi:hypothetical protein EV142_104124 [Flavobacterium circumlabens]|uniref:Uncharacterized protein n=1 Tax=Flavobacterium circumlabens TaxID=2133765 RepID=A0ABY2B0G2_9FLAO|nr:hypothetical protein EV142_104124 [Flavobacterium circumlabens]
MVQGFGRLSGSTAILIILKGYNDAKLNVFYKTLSIV